jgi:hypothetical protein
MSTPNKPSLPGRAADQGFHAIAPDQRVKASFFIVDDNNR